MQTQTFAQPAPAQPLWPYTWGRAFRRLDLPLDLLYRAAVVLPQPRRSGAAGVVWHAGGREFGTHRR